MIAEHPNISILQNFNSENIAEVSDILAEDAVWHYFNPELPELQGDYIGLEGFMGFFKKMATKTEGTFKVNPISITPVGDELVVTHVKNSMVFEDQQMEIDAIVVWRIVDGKIKEGWDIPAVYTALIQNHKN
ncbi:nuclear transport factor 2 family protein [Aquimarina sp. MMG016]|uniref:nuclear transport factor 2 family protein n=1 Tax=Aquimarina sp. MMG016 TaxID=2822690 RepID=UPI001B3A747E|nr:nuclear transport factor 2 family protein [Aquimarina sp. MMG016]MBQ4820280.1 nuclear transport factor 2 family protein [Aquimarina sp. MMG016]